MKDLPLQSQHASHVLKLIEATSAQDEVRQVRSYCVRPPRTMLTACRELEDNLVPEWRAKYINYKV